MIETRLCMLHGATNVILISEGWSNVRTWCGLVFLGTWFLSVCLTCYWCATNMRATTCIVIQPSLSMLDLWKVICDWWLVVLACRTTDTNWFAVGTLNLENRTLSCHIGVDRLVVYWAGTTQKWVPCFSGTEDLLLFYARSIQFVQTYPSFPCANGSIVCVLQRSVRRWYRGAEECHRPYCRGETVHFAFRCIPSSCACWSFEMDLN